MNNRILPSAVKVQIRIQLFGLLAAATAVSVLFVIGIVVNLLVH
ncbi:MAG: hypothetical protein WDO14_02410 [Bacteroidota bacterium]